MITNMRYSEVTNWCFKSKKNRPFWFFKWKKLNLFSYFSMRTEIIGFSFRNKKARWRRDITQFFNHGFLCVCMRNSVKCFSIELHWTCDEEKCGMVWNHTLVFYCLEMIQEMKWYNDDIVYCSVWSTTANH